jgi:hypothetical protein
MSRTYLLGDHRPAAARSPASAVLLARSSPELFGQKTIQLVGKGLTIPLTERRWSTCVHATTSQLIHKITYSKALSNIGLCIELSPWVERMSTFPDNLSSKRDISGNDQIAVLQFIHYHAIHDIETGRYSDRPDITRRRDLQRAIGDESQGYMQPPSGTKENILYNPWARIGVDPYLH